jgi:hypothetical protein
VPEHIGPYAIAGPEEIMTMELEDYVARTRGTPKSDHQVFGDGLGHIFGNPLYVRISEPLPEGLSEHQLQEMELVRRLCNREMENMILSGPPIDFPVPGIDNHSYYELSQAYVQFQLDLRDRFASVNVPKAQRRLALAAIMVRDNLNIIAKVAEKTGSPPEIMRPTSPNCMLDLVLELPTQHLVLETVARSHDNPRFHRARGDLNDVSVIPTAVVYCDVVVMERHWGSTMRQTKLDQKHGTTILFGLQELLPILESTAGGDVIGSKGSVRQPHR